MPRVRPHATTRLGVRILPTDEALAFHGHVSRDVEEPAERPDRSTGAPLDDPAPAPVRALRWHPSMGASPAVDGPAPADEGPRVC